MEHPYTPTFDGNARSTLKEWMDDTDIKGSVLTKALDEIEQINTLLGGHRCVIFAMKALLMQYRYRPGQKLTILDWGCGSGDMPRSLALFLRKTNLDFHITAVDNNEATIAYAKERSKDFPEITYIHGDIFETPSQRFDFATASLLFHHLQNEEINALIHSASSYIDKAIIVNDLRREKLAFILFKIFTFLNSSPEMARHDGLISILRSFRRKDLKQWEIGPYFPYMKIRKFPLFRWQIIMQKPNDDKN